MEMNRKITLCIVLCITVIGVVKYSSELYVTAKNSQTFSESMPVVNNDIANFDNSIVKVKILHDCGELCNTTRKGSPGIFFNQIKTRVNCKGLFENEFIDSGHNLQSAPKQIPKELERDFTMDYRLKVKPWYFDQRSLGRKARLPVWTKKQVDDWIKVAQKGKLYGNYGFNETNFLRDGLQHAPEVKNGRVLVIGSQTPWVEACVLEAGAREILTLEYGQIESRHPKVKTIEPFDFRMSFLNKTLGSFDAVVSFSSVEHSGLGRYGDALNPWGDIIAIARAWCVTKEGGSLTLGVPYANNEIDYIAFNAARFYGKIRYPYLTTNWRQLYRGKGGIQRVHVFTKEVT